ncbi:RNA methyltransferase-like protein 1 [Leptotrombidium deliense]|uniref:RNA methyltransferase-like protein 1 n=1 Tax=Leptotrombidium deliense TaxID=299467 RepID=A0A443S378_9ACAR|nr:RNA methyltransferase-like protein 1 [Leptotrombidium deliense]
MTHLKSRSKRESLKLLALEGKRLISDGIDAGLNLKTIYFSVEENLIGIKNLSLLPDAGVQLKKVFYKDLKLFSDHVTSPGVVGIFERPSTAGICKVHSRRSFDLPVTLIADNIRDPGNLGTIIRTAAAAGIERVLCVKGCVDAWESKVVRSSCGAHFRIPVIHDLEWPFIFNYIPTNAVKVYVADSSEFSQNNVEESSVSHNIEIITNAITESVVVDENTGRTMKFDESLENESILEKYRRAVLKTEDYSNVNYTSESDHVVVVVGGEASGPSLQSLKLCHDFGGYKLKIPLECGVESLNTSIAASIILYEIKRQFSEVSKSKSK